MMKIYKKIIIVVFLICALISIFYFICFKRYNDKTFIITYHKIEKFKEGLLGLAVSPENFDRQMKYLYSRGYRTISLNELIEILKVNGKIPKKVFVITFDDGYENNYSAAYPILKKYNFKATIFLNAGAIGKNYMYPSSKRPEKHLSANQIVEMSSFLDFGSHSMSHVKLSQLPDNEILRELTESKKVIEEIIKKPIDTFCYPFGDYSHEVVNITKSVYSGACTTNPDLIDSNSDAYTLPRFNFKEIKAMKLNDFFNSIDFYLKVFLSI